jgi:hypothetical protein
VQAKAQGLRRLGDSDMHVSEICLVRTTRTLVVDVDAKRS